MKKTQAINLPIQTRSAEIRTSQAQEENTDFETIWTTGAVVRRFHPIHGEYDEELVISHEAIRLATLNSGAPLLNSHAQRSVDDMLGSVIKGTARIESGKGIAQCRIDPSEEKVVQKVRNGTIKNVSVGYIMHRIDVVERADDVPLYRVTDWEPFEISLVSSPADDGAVIRSDDQTTHPCQLTTTHKETDPMDTTQEAQAPEKATPPDDTQVVDVEAIKKEAAEAAVKEERSRHATIAQIAKIGYRLSPEFIEGLRTSGKSEEQIRHAALTEMARLSDEPGEINTRHAPRCEMGEDQVDKENKAIESAIANRADPTNNPLDDKIGARDFAGCSLIEIARDYLGRRGVDARGSASAVASKAFNYRSGMYTSSDLPIILSNVAGKTLRQGYEGTQKTFPLFCRRSDAANFKERNRIQFDADARLEEVQQGSEFKSATLFESEEKYRLKKYAKSFEISQDTFIDDDMDVLGRIPATFGREAAETESDIVWSIINDNKKLNVDDKALFHASHGNLSTTADALSKAAMDAARLAMRSQKGLNSKNSLNILPKYLLAPAALEGLVDELWSDNTYPTTGQDINTYRKTITPIIEPRLDDKSTTAWYFTTDVNSPWTCIEYAYLSGQEGVQMQVQESNFSYTKFLVYLPFGAAPLEYRGMYRNPGA